MLRVLKRLAQVLTIIFVVVVGILTSITFITMAVLMRCMPYLVLLTSVLLIIKYSI